MRDSPSFPLESVPFGRVIESWRRARGMTQAELAHRAEIARPNLSMIEQGARDITLSTLKRLAEALEVKPGILADGIPPGPLYKKSWPRESLDRMAHYLLGFSVKVTPREKQAAESFRPFIQRKILLKRTSFGFSALRQAAVTPGKKLSILQNSFRAEEIRNLLSRMDKLGGKLA